MTGQHLGRELSLEWGGSQILGVREKALNINGEPVDVTSDENNGWRKLYSEAGQNQVDITISGITKSDALKSDFFSGNRTKQLTVEYPDGNILDGEFFLVSYTDTGPYNDATTFEAQFQSTGAVQLVEYS